MKVCYFCKGKIVKKKINHLHHWGSKIILFENIPAEICSQCGEIFLDPKTLKFIDNETKKRESDMRKQFQSR